LIGQLTGLIGRDFVIGYFLPVATFITASLGLAVAFGVEPGGLALTGGSLDETEVLVASTLLALVSALGGVLLMALNREVIRLMEGYPYRRLNGWQRWRYRRLSGLAEMIRTEREILKKQKKELSPERRDELEKAVAKLVTHFPDDEKWVLPTALGNTIRAFEVYPRIMYGLDAIEGWGRLLGVVPPDYREQINAAKTQMDFWVNLSLLALLFLPEYAAVAIYGDSLRVPWAPLAALVVAFFAYSRAKSAAVQWGNLAKASFDLFLPELWCRLGFAPAEDADKERTTWENFGWAIHYRAPRYLPQRHPTSPDE
jgi:hypothetical protein